MMVFLMGSTRFWHHFLPHGVEELWIIPFQCFLICSKLQRSFCLALRSHQIKIAHHSMTNLNPQTVLFMAEAYREDG